MNILSYNSRGMGSGVKWLAIRKLTMANNIDVFCIQETKKESVDAKLCQYPRVHPYEKARDQLIERGGHPKRLDTRCGKSMQLT